MDFIDWFRLVLGSWFALDAVKSVVNWRRKPDEDRHGTLAMLYALLAMVYIGMGLDG
jgi:hypothetical protein